MQQRPPAGSIVGWGALVLPGTLLFRVIAPNASQSLINEGGG